MKRALLDRGFKSDIYTVRAVKMLVARAGVTWNGGKATGPIDAYRTGWWVSGIVELGLHADRVLYRPCPSNLSLASSAYDWLGLTPETRKLCQELGIATVGDLTELRVSGEREWSYWAQTKPYLQLYMHEHSVPTGRIGLAVGQNWQVLAAFGEPDTVYEILGVAQPEGVWYKTWWKGPGAWRRAPRGGQLLYARDLAPQFAYFDELFPAYAQCRQIFLEAPKVSRAGSSHCVTRKILRWKKESNPLYPPLLSNLQYH